MSSRIKSVSLLLALTALTLSTAGLAANGSYGPAPVPGVTSEPNQPIPGICRLHRHDAWLDNVGAFDEVYTGFDYRDCSYRHMQRTITDAQINQFCKDAALREGVNADGQCTLTYDSPDDEAGKSRGQCLNQTVARRRVNIRYTTNLTEDEINQSQCKLLDRCLQEYLKDPSQILLARQWKNKLCSLSQ